MELQLTGIDKLKLIEKQTESALARLEAATLKSRHTKRNSKQSSSMRYLAQEKINYKSSKDKQMEAEGLWIRSLDSKTSVVFSEHNNLVSALKITTPTHVKNDSTVKSKGLKQVNTTSLVVAPPRVRFNQTSTSQNSFNATKSQVGKRDSGVQTPTEFESRRMKDAPTECSTLKTMVHSKAIGNRFLKHKFKAPSGAANANVQSQRILPKSSSVLAKAPERSLQATKSSIRSNRNSLCHLTAAQKLPKAQIQQSIIGFNKFQELESGTKLAFKDLASADKGGQMQITTVNFLKEALTSRHSIQRRTSGSNVMTPGTLRYDRNQSTSCSPIDFNSDRHPRESVDSNIFQSGQRHMKDGPRLFQSGQTLRENHNLLKSDKKCKDKPSLVRSLKPNSRYGTVKHNKRETKGSGISPRQEKQFRDMLLSSDLTHKESCTVSNFGALASTAPTTALKPHKPVTVSLENLNRIDSELLDVNTNYQVQRPAWLKRGTLQPFRQPAKEIKTSSNNKISMYLYKMMHQSEPVVKEQEEVVSLEITQRQISPQNHQSDPSALKGPSPKIDTKIINQSNQVPQSSVQQTLVQDFNTPTIGQTGYSLLHREPITCETILYSAQSGRQSEVELLPKLDDKLPTSGFEQQLRDQNTIKVSLFKPKSIVIESTSADENQSTKIDVKPQAEKWHSVLKMKEQKLQINKLMPKFAEMVEARVNEKSLIKGTSKKFQSRGSLILSAREKNTASTIQSLQQNQTKWAAYGRQVTREKIQKMLQQQKSKNLDKIKGEPSKELKQFKSAKTFRKEDFDQEVSSDDSRAGLFQTPLAKAFFVINERKFRSKNTIQHGCAKLKFLLNKDRNNVVQRTFQSQKEQNAIKSGKFSTIERFASQTLDESLPFKKKLGECIQSDFDQKQIRGVPIGQKRATVSAESQLLLQLANFNGDFNSSYFKNQGQQSHRSLSVQAKNLFEQQQDKADLQSKQIGRKYLQLKNEINGFTDAIQPIDINVEVIDAVKELQRCEVHKLQTIFADMEAHEVQSLKWDDLLVPPLHKNDFVDTAYRERDNLTNERRSIRRLVEPFEERVTSEKSGLHHERNHSLPEFDAGSFTNALVKQGQNYTKGVDACSKIRFSTMLNVPAPPKRMIKAKTDFAPLSKLKAKNNKTFKLSNERPKQSLFEKETKQNQTTQVLGVIFDHNNFEGTNSNWTSNDVSNF